MAAWLWVLRSDVLYMPRKRALNIPISFKNKDRMVADEALIDSGATENFMDRRAVCQLGVGRICMAYPKKV